MNTKEMFKSARLKYISYMHSTTKIKIKTRNHWGEKIYLLKKKLRKTIRTH